MAPAAKQAWPTQHALAKQWDANGMVRESLRASGKLLQWASPKATGVAGKGSLRQNRFVIEALLDEWTRVCRSPKSPPIDWIRQEVPQFQST